MGARLNFRAKLFLCFGILVALSLGLAFWAMNSLSTLGKSLIASSGATAKKIEQAGELRAGFHEMRVRAQSAQISMVMGMLEPAGASTSPHSSGMPCHTCHTIVKVEQNQQRFHEAARRLRESCRSLRNLGLDANEAASVDPMEQGIAQWEGRYDEYLRLAYGKRFGEAHQIVEDEILPAIQRMEKSALALEAHQREALAQMAGNAAKQTAASNRLALALVAISFAVGVIVSFIIVRSSGLLRTLANELQQGAQALIQSAHEIAESSQSLAQGAAAQSESLEETTTASTEVKDAARRNAESASDAATRVAESEIRSQDASEALREMVAAMNEIDESSRKISRIIATIDEISFQTNILALNAAVEAARAGVAGAGFAVVAEEVRNLAQRCAAAAGDTSALIEESVVRSERGKAKVVRVSEAIRLIAEDSRQIRALVDNVSESSRKQAAGTEQIGSAVLRIEKVTRENERAAEESAAAAEQLTGYSRELETIVGRLTEMVGGEAVNTARP